jgi:chaperone BCS1
MEEREDDTTIERLAANFANEVSELVFSPAENLSFLLENRRAPRAALENLQQWMARTGRK